MRTTAIGAEGHPPWARHHATAWALGVLVLGVVLALGGLLTGHSARGPLSAQEALTGQRTPDGLVAHSAGAGSGLVVVAPSGTLKGSRIGLMELREKAQDGAASGSGASQRYLLVLHRATRAELALARAARHRRPARPQAPPTTTVPPPPTTVPPPPTTAPAPPTTASAPPTTQAPVTTAAPPTTQPAGYGCAAAIAYLQAHAAPGYTFICPGYAWGHQAMTCSNHPPECPMGVSEIVIADPCPAAYMNEASNSGGNAPIDPDGYCTN